MVYYAFLETFKCFCWERNTRYVSLGYYKGLDFLSIFLFLKKNMIHV